MERIKNLSIKKAIICYMSISLVISFFVSAGFVMCAEKLQDRIWQKYTVDVDSAYLQESVRHPGLDVRVSRPSSAVMSEWDRRITERCDFIITYGILVISIMGSCIGMLVFYQNKLKVPLDQLNRATKRMEKNEFDFHITYKNKDEMGQLCCQYEQMRSQLEVNYHELWQLIEHERTLRSAISHDIRSPLAVLKGYQEMMLEFLPENELNQEEMINMLKEGMGQIERLEHFVEAIRHLSSIEERQPKPEQVSADSMVQKISDEVRMLCKEKVEVKLISEINVDCLSVDLDLVLEVVDNLVSNAIRYAKTNILCSIAVNPSQLEVTVIDDGIGFQVSPDLVTKAFYYSNPEDDLTHSGLGMYVCSLYCKKHGGRLLISNSKQGGGNVKAIFSNLS